MMVQQGETEPTEKGALRKSVCRKLSAVFCPHKIDQRMFLPLLLILLNEGITGASLNSYASYLVFDVGAASSIDDVGTWVGILTSVYFAFQLVACLVFGFLGDRFNRRNLLLVGLFGIFASQLAFGFCVNIGMAIALRAVNGLFNGNVSMVKAMMGCITDSRNRVKAFSYVGLMFGVGTIIGSSVGGVTARPAIAYPDVFSPTGFFAEWPYALSNIVTSSFVLFAFVITFVFLHEPPRTPKAAAAVALGSARSDSGYRELGSGSEEVQIDEFTTAVVVEVEGRSFDVLDTAIADQPRSKNGCAALGKNSMIATLLYAVTSIILMIIGTLIATWCVATVEAGGLGFSAANVGVVSAVGGVGVVITLLLVVDFVVKKLKLLWTLRLFSLLLVPVACCMPFANTLAVKFGGQSWQVWLFILFCFFAWQMLAQVTMNCAIVMVANSVPPERMGAVNGVSQAFASLARSVSPVTVGALLVWTLEPERVFPTNHWLLFFIAAAIALVLLACSFLMPSSINRPFAAAPKTSPPPPPSLSSTPSPSSSSADLQQRR